MALQRCPSNSDLEVSLIDMGGKRAESHLSPSFFCVAYMYTLLDTQRKKKNMKEEIKD